MTASEYIDEIMRRLASNERGSAAGLLHGRSNAVSYWQIVDALPRIQQQDTDWNATSGLIDDDLPRSVRRYLEQLRTMDSMAQCPIVAIAGMLNAGKSSMLAGFLSSKGRERVLIGQSNHEGTHRFVLWIPESWRKDPGVWQLTINQLASVFGAEPELLADDLETASRQYNGEMLLGNAVSSDADTLSIPLLATDPMLDQWGLAMMDCPDIQTGLLLQNRDRGVENDRFDSMNLRHPRTESEQSKDRAFYRARVLMKAMQLCSAFITIAPANGLRDQLILDLLEAMRMRMPGIPRILVVNRVPRRYLSSEIMEEVKDSMAAFELQKVYMAYHFDGPLLREKLPPADLMGLNATERNLPIAFRIDQPNPPQPPEPIRIEDYLVSIGSQVDCGKLMGACRATLAGQLEVALQAAWFAAQREMKERHLRLSRVWQLIADACVAFSMGHNDEDLDEPQLRLHASQKIIAQLSSSLERTAPWWAKPSRMVVRVAQIAKDKVSETANRMIPLSWMGSKSQEVVDFVKGKLRRGEIGKVVNANTLVEALQSSDLRGDLSSSVLKLEPKCQSMIDRFQSESQTLLDDEQVDAMTSQIWIRMGWRQRLWQGFGPAALAFAPLLAVIAIPFDLGGSSVLVLASLKELLFAGALGAGLALGKRDGMPKIAEQHAAWQQLSDLFAIGCDQLGLPRPNKEQLPQVTVGRMRDRLGDSVVKLPTALCEPVIQLPIDLDLRFLEPIKELLQRLKEDASR